MLLITHVKKKKKFYILTEIFSGEKEKGIFTDQTETGGVAAD